MRNHTYVYRSLSDFEKALAIALATLAAILAVALLFTLNWGSIVALVFFVPIGLRAALNPLFMSIRWQAPNYTLEQTKETDFSVDVFVTCYDEPIDLISNTLSRCNMLSGTYGTVLLDDGNREELRVLCEELGVQYLARGDNEGAKAGNLNFGLANTSSDLIAVFDADGYPEKNFLECLIPYFDDPRVAIVQAYSVIENPAAFQNPNLGDCTNYFEEHVFFYRIIENACEAFGSPIWSGSGAVLRREALQSIGGVRQETVTEDYHTSLALLLSGYKIKYDPRPLSYSSDPEAFSSFLTQRIRWMSGTCDSILRNIREVVKSTHLTIRAKIRYFSDLYFYSRTCLLVPYLVFLALIALAEYPLFVYPELGILLYITFSFTFGMLWSMLDRLEKETFSSTDIYVHLTSFPFLVQAISFAMGKKVSFITTPKGDKKDRFQFTWYIPIHLCLTLSCLLVATRCAQNFLDDGAALNAFYSFLFLSSGLRLLQGSFLIFRSLVQQHSRTQLPDAFSKTIESRVGQT